MNQNLDEKRCIFTRKSMFENKETFIEKKPIKMVKKYSNNYETERAEEIARDNSALRNSPVTNNKNTMYNRRPMSPLKNSFKPMVFSLSSRKYQKHY